MCDLLGVLSREVGVPLPAGVANEGERLFDVEAAGGGGAEGGAVALPCLALLGRGLVTGGVWDAVSDEHHEVALDSEVVLHAWESVAAEAGGTILGVEFQEPLHV